MPSGSGRDEGQALAKGRAAAERRKALWSARQMEGLVGGGRPDGRSLGFYRAAITGHPLAVRAPAVPQQGADHRPTVRPGVLLVGIAAVAMLLRFARLGQHSVFFDEAYIAWLSLHRWRDLLALLRSAEFHPPLHYVLMKAWIALAGPGEAALRTPSAVFGSMSVFLTYLLVRKVASESVSLLSALFVAVSPFEIMAGQNGKMYGLLEVLTLGSTLALAEAAGRGARRWWSAYVALATAMVYTHYLSVFVLAAHGVWMLCCWRVRLTQWLAAVLMIALLYAPWAPLLWTHLGHARASESWGGPPRRRT